MARFDQGWVKVWRSSFHGDLVGNVYLWGIWHWLLLAATWKPSKILWNGEQRELPPGSVVFGLEELSKKWHCSRTTVSNWLKYLHQTGRVVYEPSKRGCIVTIRNWEQYQSQDEGASREAGQSSDKACTGPLREVAFSEEGKNPKREESGNPIASAKEKVSGDSVRECISEWALTLKHFQIARKPNAQDELKIARAVQAFGADWVKLAFQGARKQSKAKNFDPKNFVSLSLYLHKDKIERLVNIGAGKESGEGIDWTGFFGSVK